MKSVTRYDGGRGRFFGSAGLTAGAKGHDGFAVAARPEETRLRRRHAAGLAAAHEDIKDDARRRLGRLFDPGDYPCEARDRFGVDRDFPSAEPPSYLTRIAPEVFGQERQRAAARFGEAVRLAEQAFAAEFAPNQSRALYPSPNPATDSEVIALIESNLSLARAYRTVLRRSLMGQGQRHSRPLPPCRAGDGGLTLQSVHGEMALCFHQPGARPPENTTFRAHALAEFEGRTDAPVLLDQVAEGKARARRDDAGVPRVMDIDTVTPDSVPAFPEIPDQFAPMPPGFLTVLDKACRTAGKEPGGRVALTRIQLRG